MMRYILIFLISNFTLAQSNESIILLEEYTLDNYIVPNSLVFYASHHYESKGFYDLIYNRVQKKSNHDIKYIFNSLQSAEKLPLFYNTKVLNTTSQGYDFVCYFDIAITDESKNKYCKNEKCSFYFYMKLVDVKTNEVLIKRKYLVNAKKYFYTNTKNLTDIILKDLKLKS